MSNFKKILVGAVFAAATTVVATAASAAVVVSATNGPDTQPLPSGQSVLLDFEDAGDLAFLSGNYSIQTGFMGGQYAQPWQDLTNFIVVPANGSPAPQTADINVTTLVGSGINSFSFYWGSIDRFNEVRLYNGATLLHTTVGVGNGAQGLPATNQRWNFALSDGDRYVTRIELYSNGKAFEADDFAFSAVPEPATWAMMIIGFGGVGSMVRSARRKQAAAFA